MVSLRTVRWVILALSLALYVAACALPALRYRLVEMPKPSPYVAHPSSHTIGELDVLFGGMSLLLGWIGPLTLDFTWYANPVLWLAWIGLLVRRNKLAMWASSGALLISAWMFLGLPQYRYEHTTGVYTYELDQWLPGYYLWMGSLLFTFVGAWWIWWLARRGRLAQPVVVSAQT